MKKRLAITICIAGFTALNLSFMPAARAQSPEQTPPSNPISPEGTAANSKAPGDTADQHNGSTGMGMNSASSPDKTNTKDTTNSLDKNPSNASTDSAPKSATKDPNPTTADEHQGTSEKGSSAPFTDKGFIMKAAQGGMTEVELGKLAQDKGSSADVKGFGSHMVMDHSKANDELKGIAQKQGVEVPATLDAHHQAMVDKMNKLSGSAFDHAYVDAMIKAHKKDAMEFQKASMSAQDPELKNFAAKTLTMVKAHLADIESIQSKMK